MKTLTDFLDANGFVGHLWPGGSQRLEFGDGALRFGQYYAAKYLTEAHPIQTRMVFSALAFKLIQFGEPVRNPDVNFWWGQPGTMSRDQILGLACANKIMNLTSVNSALENKLKARNGFAWNTKSIWPKPGEGSKIPDLCGPETFRILETDWSYARVLAADIFAVASAAAQVATQKIAPSHTSPIQVGVMLILARRTRPTFLSRLAEKIFTNGIDWRGALKSYFADENAPPLDVLLIKAMEG